MLVLELLDLLLEELLLLLTEVELDVDVAVARYGGNELLLRNECCKYCEG